PSAGGPQQIEEQTDGGRFACAIQTEKAEDLALNDVQIEIIQRGGGAISFREATNRNGGRLRVSRAHGLVSEGSFANSILPASKDELVSSTRPLDMAASF